MWILVQVETVIDVGLQEQKRYRLSDNSIKIEQSHLGNVRISGQGTQVHPATTDMNQKSIEDLCNELHKRIVSKRWDDISPKERRLLEIVKDDVYGEMKS